MPLTQEETFLRPLASQRGVCTPWERVRQSSPSGPRPAAHTRWPRTSVQELL